LATVLETAAEAIKLRTQAIGLVSEARTGGSTTERIAASIRDLRRVAEDLREHKGKEPGTYHWRGIGDLIVLLSPTLGHYEMRGRGLDRRMLRELRRLSGRDL